MKISVVLPIFNIAKYLPECIESLLEQKFEGFEILLINDGSTDNSFEICKNYSEKDHRIRIFNIPNQGVSVARNIGLKNAKGEYVIFIDPDDWIDKNMLSKMYGKIVETSADMCICGYKTFDSNNKITEFKITQAHTILNKDDILKSLLPNIITPKNFDEEAIMGSVWRILFKKEILDITNLKFKKNITLMEDLVFCIEALLEANKIILMEECFYNYRLRKDSATLKYRENFTDIVNEVEVHIETLVERAGLNELYEVNILNRRIKNSISIISNETRNTSQNRKQILNNLYNICNDDLLQKAIQSKYLKIRSIKYLYLITLIKKRRVKLLYFSYILMNKWK